MNELKTTQLLYEAIENADVEHVKHLIRRSKEGVKQMTPFGTWLHVAATDGTDEVVQTLISLGADVNARGGAFDGGAINVAAAYGKLSIVRILFASGAIFDTSEPVRNPLFSAIQGGHMDIVQFLIEQGIDSLVRYTGESMRDMDAIAFARERGEIKIMNYLINLAPNV